MSVHTHEIGPWHVRLHPPVCVYRGTRSEHVTRPNICQVGDALAVIYQTTFDTSATPHDERDISISHDAGRTWAKAAHGVDIGSFAILREVGADPIVLPYDSIRFGDTDHTLAGPRVVLHAGVDGLQMQRDRATLYAPAALKGFIAEPIVGDDGRPLYLADDLPPSDKPITAFWGTGQRLPDGRWIIPAYGCYAADPYARHSPAPEMRRLARFTTELYTSADDGRTWQWYSRIATPDAVPDACVEGPSEVHLFRYPSRWRAVFRTSALKGHFQPMRYADSVDAGRTWGPPRILPDVGMLMDPRGLILADGSTVLVAGRPKVDLYLAEGDEPAFLAVGLTQHHAACIGRLRTTGHTDIVELGPGRLLVVYDEIPDSWRWPGSPFTAPDAIWAVELEITR